MNLKQIRAMAEGSSSARSIAGHVATFHPRTMFRILDVLDAAVAMREGMGDVVKTGAGDYQNSHRCVNEVRVSAFDKAISALEGE